MSLLIIICLICGVFAGNLLSAKDTAFIDNATKVILFIMIFSVGIDLGLNKDTLKKIKDIGLKSLLIPIGSFVGSFIGAIVISFFISESIADSLAVSMGMGWYSFTGIIISEGGNESLGAIGFLANVFREVLTIIFIPTVAKYISPYAAIATAGATTMDTTLGVISRSTKGELILESLISGMVITMVVPLVVPLFI